MQRFVKAAVVFCAAGAVVVSVVPASALTGTSSWHNSPLAAQAGAFSVEFDAVPNAAGMDGVIGLSPSAASSYNDCAAMVRFNMSGMIDVRNGGSYAADAALPYQPGTTYRFRMDVDPATGLYSVVVAPQGGQQVALATDYAFRTEQAGATTLANWATISGVGSHTVEGFRLVGDDSGDTWASSATWQNRPFEAQSGAFDATFAVVPHAANMDGVIGLAPAPAASYNDCAAIVRFNMNGTIDVRNGNRYAADATLAYTPEMTYHVTMKVDVTAKTYSVTVTPEGGQPVTLATDYGFRSEQAHAGQLTQCAILSSPGTQTISKFAVQAARPVELLVNAGPDKTVDIADMVVLEGSVTVDGVSMAWNQVDMQWTQVSGPGEAKFANVIIPMTLARFSETGTYVLRLTATYNGQTASDTVSVEVISPGVTATTNWQNFAVPTQTGRFQAEFDAVPNDANMDGVIALSAAAVGNYNECAVLVRFAGSGTIDARNGSSYAANTAVNYTPGTTYHFRLVVDVPARTYDVYVTPEGGSEQSLGRGFAFRTEQTAITQLANWATIAGVGSHTVSNFQLGEAPAAPLTANAGGDRSIVAGESTTLSGSAAGGKAPYTYKWSPTTGLGSPNAATTTAAPQATQVYTLTVTDAAGQTATDSITVTVSSVSTDARYVATNGNDSNSGTSSAPWRTIAKAASTAQAGTTVIVRSGTYNESLRPAYSGQAGKLIIFKSETPRGAVLDGQQSRSSGVDLQGRQYVRVDGFEIRNFNSNGVYLQGRSETSVVGVEIANNYIHHNGNTSSWGSSGIGIQAQNARNTLIDGNEIYHNGDTAVAIGGEWRAENVTIRGNNIHYNGRDGIKGGGHNIIIEYNFMHNQCHTTTHQDATEIWQCDGLIVRYNVIGDFTQLVYGGMGAGGQYLKNIQVYGNVFYNHYYWNRHRGSCPAVWFDARKGPSGAPFEKIYIHSNTFLFLGEDISPIMLYGSSSTSNRDVRIYNNIFYRCRGLSRTGNAYSVGSEMQPLYSDYNCFYGMTPAGGNANSIHADPRLVNYSVGALTFDARLRSDSPCIDAGPSNLGSLVPLPSNFTDADGKARPLGGGYDMGAYER